MTRARIHTLWQYRACLLLAALLLAGTAEAQLSLKRQKYDSIAARYSKEHAVYLENSRVLVISSDEGKLVGKSTFVSEKLFISDKSLNVYNTDPVYSYNYTDVIDLGAVKYLPEGNDYREYVNHDKQGRITNRYTGLQKKSITRTSFVQEHEEVSLLQPFDFGESIPVLNTYFEVRAPRYVKMGFLLKGADTSKIKRSVKEDGAMIVYRFSARDLPAVKQYNAVPDDKYYITHVIPYVVSYRLPGARKDSVINGSIDAHARRQYDFVNGLNYKTDTFISNTTKRLIKGAYSDKEKVDRIYNWVQNNFRYESFSADDHDRFYPNPADTVYKRAYGDCKDMSSIISAMCGIAGIDAYCALIGTNMEPYTHDEVLTSHLYNHMVCAVKLNGEWYFPDGTNHIQPLGANRWDIQGKEAMILLDRTRHEIVKIPEAPASANVVTVKTVLNLAYNDVTGTIHQHYSGYGAWNIGEVMAYYNRKEERDEYVKSLTIQGNNKYIIDNYSVDISKTNRKDVDITAHFSIGDYVQHVKRDYFVNMNLKPWFTELRMNDTDRAFPMYTKWKRTIKETVTLNIPRGFHVSHVPKAAKGGVKDLWSYNISYRVNNSNRTVVLTREYVLNTMKIEPSQFAANNKLVDQLKKLYKETVVLTAN